MDNINGWVDSFYMPETDFRSSQILSGSSTRWDFPKSRGVTEKILCQNIIPFWYPEVIDLKDGGYKLNHNLEGTWLGPINKRLVTQARTLWFFSHLTNTEYGMNEHLDAARHGYEFLYRKLWDKEFGGFYWEVSSTGSIATNPNKHLYGQSCGLYALSEYSIASGDSSSTELARRLFRLLEDHAHDPVHGGYREFFWQDWVRPPAEHKEYIGATAYPITPKYKMMNTHLHLLEAITNYYLVTNDPLARERIIELIFILTNAVVRRTVGACTDAHQENWAPLHESWNNHISYGHDIENVWILIEACKVAKLSNSPLVDLYRTLFSYALRYGFDPKKGGFYNTGPYNQTADRREKIWWVQSEALISALKMYELTGEEDYAVCFSKTLDWIVNYQVDWDHGDWYAKITSNGKPMGNKAGMWKSPYHNGRAMIECLEILPALIENDQFKAQNKRTNREKV